LTTIAHITDLHFGREDPAIAHALANNLLDLKPDLIVVGGDLTQRARPSQFKSAKQFLSQFHCHQQVIPGNHDVPLWSFPLRLLAPFHTFNRFFTSTTPPAFENADVCVVALNTARRCSTRIHGFWKDGLVRKSELAAACTRFATSASRFKICVTHHPLVTPPGPLANEAASGGRDAIPHLRACGVSLLLSGHLHHAFRIDLGNGLQSVAASTACSTRTRVDPCGFSIVRIADTLTTTSSLWTGTRFEEMESRSYFAAGSERSTGTGS